LTYYLQKDHPLRFRECKYFSNAPSEFDNDRVPLACCAIRAATTHQWSRSMFRRGTGRRRQKRTRLRATTRLELLSLSPSESLPPFILWMGFSCACMMSRHPGFVTCEIEASACHGVTGMRWDTRHSLKCLMHNVIMISL
jgi:hypothetical protein